MNTSTAHTEETCKIYRVNTERQKGILIFFVPMLFISLIVVGAVGGVNIARARALDLDTFVFPACCALMCIIGAWKITHHVDETYLLLSSSRLEYHSQEIDIATTWSNVQSITNRYVAPALLLCEPAATRVPSLSRDPFITRRIPLYSFDYTDTSELGRDLHRFAPHLFAARRG